MSTVALHRDIQTAVIAAINSPRFVFSLLPHDTELASIISTFDPEASRRLAFSGDSFLAGALASTLTKVLPLASVHLCSSLKSCLLSNEIFAHIMAVVRRDKHASWLQAKVTRKKAGDYFEALIGFAHDMRGVVYAELVSWFETNFVPLIHVGHSAFNHFVNHNASKKHKKRKRTFSPHSSSPMRPNIAKRAKAGDVHRLLAKAQKVKQEIQARQIRQFGLKSVSLNQSSYSLSSSSVKVASVAAEIIDVDALETLPHVRENNFSSRSAFTFKASVASSSALGTAQVPVSEDDLDTWAAQPLLTSTSLFKTPVASPTRTAYQFPAASPPPRFESPIYVSSDESEDENIYFSPFSARPIVVDSDSDSG